MEVFFAVAKGAPNSASAADAMTNLKIWTTVRIAPCHCEYLFVVPNYGRYMYLGGRDFPLHGIRSKKGLRKKYLLGMVPNCIGITVVCCMRHNT